MSNNRKQLEALTSAMLVTADGRAQVRAAFEGVAAWTLRSVQAHLGSKLLRASAAAFNVRHPFAPERKATGAKLAPWMQGPRMAPQA